MVRYEQEMKSKEIEEIEDYYFIFIRNISNEFMDSSNTLFYNLINNRIITFSFLKNFCEKRNI